MRYFYAFIFIFFFSIFILKVDLSIPPEEQDIFTSDVYSPFDKDTSSLTAKSSDTIPRMERGKLRLYSAVALGGCALFLTSGAIQYLSIALHGSCNKDMCHGSAGDLLLFRFSFEDFTYFQTMIIVIPLFAGFAYTLGVFTDKLSSTGSVLLCSNLITAAWLILRIMNRFECNSSFVPYRGLFSGILSLSIIPLIKGVYSSLIPLSYLPRRYLCCIYAAFPCVVIMSYLFMTILVLTYPSTIFSSENFSMIGNAYIPITLIILVLFALTVNDPSNVPQEIDEKRNVINKEEHLPKFIFSTQFALILLACALSVTQTHLFFNLMVTGLFIVDITFLYLVVTLVSIVLCKIGVLWTALKFRWGHSMMLATFLSGLFYTVMALPFGGLFTLSVSWFIFVYFFGSIITFLSYIFASTNSNFLGRVLALSFGSVYLFTIVLGTIVSYCGLNPYSLEINIGMAFIIMAIITRLDCPKPTEDSNKLDVYKLDDVVTWNLPEKSEKNLHEDGQF